jgi:hypothetical protein
MFVTRKITVHQRHEQMREQSISSISFSLPANGTDTP